MANNPSAFIKSINGLSKFMPEAEFESPETNGWIIENP